MMCNLMFFGCNHITRINLQREFVLQDTCFDITFFISIPVFYGTKLRNMACEDAPMDQPLLRPPPSTSNTPNTKSLGTAPKTSADTSKKGIHEKQAQTPKGDTEYKPHQTQRPSAKQNSATTLYHPHSVIHTSKP